eukprot:7493448-Pyramimonas_sp.AAC.1
MSSLGVVVTLGGFPIAGRVVLWVVSLSLYRSPAISISALTNSSQFWGLRYPICSYELTIEGEDMVRAQPRPQKSKSKPKQGVMDSKTQKPDSARLSTKSAATDVWTVKEMQ